MKDDLFQPWCVEKQTGDKRKSLRLLQEREKAQPTAIETLRSIVPTHYYDPTRISRWLKKWGKQKCLATLKSNLPAGKKARSGDIGEILATEYVNRKLEYRVPIFRLRWRDDRDMALRGDDIFAVRSDENGLLYFLKGEVKSRQKLSADTLAEAGASLKKHDGRPAPYTINFVVNRLDELGQSALSEQLENYLSPKSIPPKRVTHLVFTVSSNNPLTLLQSHLDASSAREQIAVGLQVDGHAAFIAAVFDEVNLA